MKEIIKQLKKLDQASINEGISTHFIEVLSNSDETVISANKEGLTWLALQCLKLAENGSEAAHVHIDESSIADKAEVAVVLARKSAEWD